MRNLAGKHPKSLKGVRARMPTIYIRMQHTSESLEILGPAQLAFPVDDQKIESYACNRALLVL